MRVLEIWRQITEDRVGYHLAAKFAPGPISTLFRSRQEHLIYIFSEISGDLGQFGQYEWVCRNDQWSCLPWINASSLFKTVETDSKVLVRSFRFINLKLVSHLEGLYVACIQRISLFHSVNFLNLQPYLAFGQHLKRCFELRKLHKAYEVSREF